MRTARRTNKESGPTLVALSLLLLALLCLLPVSLCASASVRTATADTGVAPHSVDEAAVLLQMSALVRGGGGSRSSSGGGALHSASSSATPRRLSSLERQQRLRNRRALRKAALRAQAVDDADAAAARASGQPAAAQRGRGRGRGRSGGGGGSRVTGGRVDFGCGSSKCTCPLPVSAGFGELRVEGYRLLGEQRLMESAACFRTAVHLFLERVGRYYVAVPGDGNADGDISLDVPAATPSAAAAAAVAAAPPVRLADAAVTSARSAAQAIVDKLNAGPARGWAEARTREAPSLQRVRSLGAAADEAARAMQRAEAEGQAGAHWAPTTAAAAPTPAAPEPRPVRRWEPSNDAAQQRALARIYRAQLRDQWRSWSAQQEAEGKGNGKGKAAPPPPRRP